MSSSSTLSGATTAAWRMDSPQYPASVPFHPAQNYPEYRAGTLGAENQVYAGVRGLLQTLGLDRARFGTPEWNPLGELVRPGDKVVLKPNLIWHAHRYRHDEWQQVITHGSIVRAVADYVLLALQGRGGLWIVDGPQLHADW